MNTRTNPYLIVGSTLFLVLALLALYGFFFCQDYDQIDLMMKESPPSSAHLLGTDSLGRDILQRLLFGLSISMWIGGVATLTQLSVGVGIGLWSGYCGGNIDFVLMRMVDTLMCFPTLMLAVAVSSVIPSTIGSISLLIGLLTWTGVARIIRSYLKQLKHKDFILQAHLSNFSFIDILTVHLLPNIFPLISVSATLGMAQAIIMEASLSFLGLGVQIPMPSLGNMLSDSLDIRSLQHYWWTWLPAGITVVLLVLSINLIGQGLRIKYRKD